MIKEIHTEILIYASPQKVWAVLTDFANYPTWNPFVKSVEVTVEVGNKITVKLPKMSFNPMVLAFEKNKEFRWSGNLFFEGLFDGEHSFVLVDNQDGTTTFKHSEKFAGILLGFFRKMLDKETKKGFEEMNQKLKEQAEKI